MLNFTKIEETNFSLNYFTEEIKIVKKILSIQIGLTVSSQSQEKENETKSRFHFGLMSNLDLDD